MPLSHLPDRSVLAVTGADRVAFLQGLVSNDVTAAVPGRAVWAALLTPQGKYLADFFIVHDTDRLLLDVEAALADTISVRLRRYRLRSAIEIAGTDLLVHAGWGAIPMAANALVAADPRLPEAGWRVLAGSPLQTDAAPDEWDRHRLRLGLPDGSRDLDVDKSVLLEAGFDELGGVSWTKGCYMGQELTARTRYRGLVKRRLLPVTSDGTLPSPGTAILAGEREVGTMRSSRDGLGLALMRLDALGETLHAGGHRLTTHPLPWMRLPG